MRKMARLKTAEAIRVAFGSCQERKMFPTHSVPNRMGNEQPGLHGSDELGPGSYHNQVDTIIYNLRTKPTVTPSPQKYQQDWSASRACCPGKAPFNSISQRFSSKSATVSCNPGPGFYDLETMFNQKVSWPMKFGSPDWSKVALPEKKALHTELHCDKEFLKHRNRVAYLSMFYS